MTAKEAVILAAMCGFAAFNLHNADSRTILHVFTLVPGILFTFRIVAINNDKSTLSISAVALFWMYYGMGLICEVLLGSDESYAAVQLVLVGALGVTAYRGTPKDRGLDTDDFRTIVSGSCSLIQQKTQQSQVDRPTGAIRRTHRQDSIPTAVDWVTRVQRTQSGSDLTSATACEITEQSVQDALMTALLSDTTTALEIFPPRPQRSSEPLLTAGQLVELNHVPICSRNLPSIQAATLLELQVHRPVHCPQLLHCLVVAAIAGAWERRLLVFRVWQRSSQFFNEVEDGSVVIDYTALSAEPLKTIRFTLPSDTQMLRIKNISGQNLKWIVKTNAIYEIRAFPAQGVLHRGETAQIKVVLNSSNVVLPETIHYDDKLAIDYEFLGGARSRCKRQRILSPVKKRYQFDIFYSF
ncbi:unnamed protein product [Heligmosomoides polygyrus]|uniref:Major sperm protein n=1 Tax=Heligmosomoides polygyrus TaxID=6339 RepID=A0A3P7WP92_HELPZ|nr:unnamed protein product [Heligmosomoides polygyrus]